MVSHSAFDQNGTFYVLHGDKLYVSFNQGESFAFVHTIPRYGSARRSDPGSDQAFVVDCGTIHIGLLEDANNGNARVYYLRGSNVDTATPTWDEELVDEVGSVRLDFLYIVLDGNGIPTISYTTPGQEVTTASRVAAPGNNSCVAAVSAVSRKTHGANPAQIFDIDLPLIGNPGIESRSGTPTGKEFQVIFTFPYPVSVGDISIVSTDGLATADAPVANGVTVTVDLHNVSNAQVLGITLKNVTHGTDVGDVGVTMGVLLGDVNGNGVVSNTDVASLKAQVSAPVSSSNFRSDANANGIISNTDVAITKARVGSTLP